MPPYAMNALGQQATRREGSGLTLPRAPGLSSHRHRIRQVQLAQPRQADAIRQLRGAGSGVPYAASWCS